jgi:hypothetical protein
MWNLLKKSRDEECGELRDLLEESAAARPEAVRVEELSEDWPSAQREHLSTCESCQEAAQDLFATREIFQGVASQTDQARPWFATRVMEAIRTRERELALPASLWSAFPRFASRLAWVSAVVLLAGSAWLYERPVAAPNKAPAAASTQEYLFEAPPPPMNQDDVLISMAEKNQ